MPPRRRTTSTGPAFTLDLPKPLEARKDGDAWWVEVDGQELRLSNLNKVFWPAEGYTKGDLLAYYWNVADLIGPHLEGRPLTMKRMPDGAEGPHFYEKTAPSHTPAWIHRCKVLSEDSKHGEIDYLMVDDTATLLYVANLGCIEMHPLHSRCADVAHPDYLFFDLDPFPPYTYEDVLTVARHIKVILDQLGLTAYPKTSGATGLQIYVPVAARRVHLRAGPRVRRRLRPDDHEGRPRSRHDGLEDRRPRRQGLHRPQHEPAGREHRGRVLAPPRAAGTGLDAAHLGRGLRGRLRTAGLPDRQRLGPVRRAGDLFAGVRTEATDLTSAFEALGVKADEDGLGSPRALRDGRAARSPEDLRRDRRGIEGPEPLRVRPATRLRREGTTEPAPGETAGHRNSFVIHKHRATRLHYDVRLERDGGLPSWAVPRGLPVTKGEKRLAVQTEVHPLEYGSFEGTIPEGHYGAGEVRIFDDGWYEPIEWTDTKVSFRLHGRRYPGLEFHFVKTRTDWLAFLASAQDAPPIATPPRFQPMLAEGGGQPFDDPSWRFEPKLDGIRALAEMETGGTVFRTRRGRDVTFQYPDIHMSTSSSTR